MRLLHYTSDDKLSLVEFSDNFPKYAILSHRWGLEEVVYQGVVDGRGQEKAGYHKIQFCGEQARRDGIGYFWVDSCCINKESSAELTEAINSMYRWYQDSTRCYVYLTDVSTQDLSSANPTEWSTVFRKSVWFSRGWTVQELIAPTTVQFFSKEQQLVGDKKLLEREICDRTGIPVRALRGQPADFSVTERFTWAASRTTLRGEDMAYCLLGLLDVNMPLIYGEGRENALERLRETIRIKLKGSHYEEFQIAFSLSNVPNIDKFIAREEEIFKIHQVLSADGSRRVAALHGLGGIGKPQLSIEYAKRYKDHYSAIFWISIKDEDAAKQGFARIASHILEQYPSTDRFSSLDFSEDLDKVVDAVKAWLSLAGNTRWLLIFDNYDNPLKVGNPDLTTADIQKFLPRAYQGSIIITTRLSNIGFGSSIAIQKLNKVEDSLAILSAT